MNPIFSIYSRMNERTKLILVAVLAFWLGGLLKGSSSVGRYQQFGSNANLVLDTQKGTVWEMRGTRFQETASMPW